MSSDSPSPRDGDPYSRVDYRRMVAWERRIAREAPLLERLLDRAPDRSVVDLGCGTGEHVAYFAERGVRAVGIDSSESMIEAARDHEERGDGRFLLGDAREASRLLADEDPFGLALCLGNMLPHLLEQEDLWRLLHSAHDILAPGGVFLMQALNYTRILEGDVRHLPLNFREGEQGKEIVFLRLMSAQPDGRMLFFPTTLELDPEAADPVSLKSTKRVELRAWTAEEVAALLVDVGFDVSLLGDMEGGALHPPTSTDLVVVATRRDAS